MLHSEKKMTIAFNFDEVKAAGNLPSPSGTALAIMKFVQREDASVQKLAQLVRVDPALSGRIIGLANSVAMGGRRPVADIQEAVLRVGMNAVKNFALSLSLIDGYGSGQCKGFPYERFWSESLLLGVLLSSLTVRERTVVPEEAFTLGLLSDIGRLALATAWPDDFSDCLKTEKDERALLKVEQSRFAIDHFDLTILMLDDWGMPIAFLEALKLSRADTFPEGRNGRIAEQIALARRLVAYCLTDGENRLEILPTIKTAAARLNLNETELPSFVDEVLGYWRDWGKQLGINTRIEADNGNGPKLANTQEEAVETLDAPITILLVDKDPELLKKVSTQLTVDGYRVDVANSIDRALQWVVERKPQILITGMVFEGKSGLDLCRILRANQFGQSIYIIVQSADSKEQGLVEAFEAGVDDYVIKPVSPRLLSARILAGVRVVKLQRDLWEQRKAIERVSSELVVSNRQLKKLAHSDPLTGLPNRRYAVARLEKECRILQRNHLPLSLLLVDLDNFKTVNDTLGHDVGDLVLKHTAKVMSARLRASDVLCRFGGEEFVVIAPNTDSANALALAERIRAEIENKQIEGHALTRKVTASIGVAYTNGKLDNWEELVRLADKAMYEIKYTTKNGVGLAR